MSESSNLSPEHAAVRRLAAARAARLAVDHNGQPTGKASTYTYDEAGRLVSATPAPAEDED